MNRLSNVLFLDIETVSQAAVFEDLEPSYQELWQSHAQKRFRTTEYDILKDHYHSKAGIYAEFGKIICISVGYFSDIGEKPKIRVKSFFNGNEAALLKAFARLIENHYFDPRKHYFSGHNIKEFDLPYICRRMIINRVPIPKGLNLMGKKPWENTHILDTLEMWRFGDYKNYTSLHLLANTLNIPTSKDDINGSEVGRVYWEEDDILRIVEYCEKDVFLTAKLYLSLLGEDWIDKIEMVRIGQEFDEEE